MANICPIPVLDSHNAVWYYRLGKRCGLWAVIPPAAYHIMPQRHRQTRHIYISPGMPQATMGGYVARQAQASPSIGYIGSCMAAPDATVVTPRTQSQGPRRPWLGSSLRRQEAIAGYIAILPWFLGFLRLGLRGTS